MVSESEADGLYGLYRCLHKESKFVFYKRSLSLRHARNELEAFVTHKPTGRLDDGAIERYGELAKALGTDEKGRCYFFSGDWEVKRIMYPVSQKRYHEFIGELIAVQKSQITVLNVRNPSYPRF